MRRTWSPATRLPSPGSLGLFLMAAGTCMGCPAEPPASFRGGPDAGPVLEAASEPSPSFRFDLDEEDADRGPRTAPMELTAADGTGLRLVSLQAHAVVEGPIAFTELHLRFHNPEPRVREGRFRIVLPHGAAISRLAMKITDRWQEGEVVERQAARVAYEDFLHRRQDPALLEAARGNEFAARVFPIPASGTKDLILSYSQEITSKDAPYRLPLRGLPQLSELRIDAQILKGAPSPSASSLGGELRPSERVTLEKTDWAPTEDFVLPPETWGPDALRHQNLVAVRLQPVRDEEASPVHGLSVLLDRSASMALQYGRMVDRVEALIRGLAAGRGPDTPVKVWVFDQTVVSVFDGTAGGFAASEAAESLRAMQPMGASNLKDALDRVAEERGGTTRLLLVTDGVLTAGPPLVKDASEALKAAGFRRMDAWAVGDTRDLGLLTRLVRSALPEPGVVLKDRMSLREMGHRLESATHARQTVEVEGARWVWPQELVGLQAHDAVVVYADMESADAPVRLRIDGQPRQLGAFVQVERPLIERAWVRARIERLQAHRHELDAEDSDLRGALDRQIVELSTKHRVLTNLTALLVLETEADYQRFQIARRGLADILVVGPRGVEVKSRERPEQAKGRFKSRALEGEALEDALVPPSEDPVPPASPGSPRVDASANEGISGRNRPGLRNVLSTGGRGAGGGGLAEVFVERAEASAEYRAEDPPHDRQAAPMEVRRRRPRTGPPEPGPAHKPKGPPPVTGPLAQVQSKLEARRLEAAENQARNWVAQKPGDPLAWVALAEVAEARAQPTRAARAYGSILDLFPFRADLRRFVGQRLERVGTAPALALALDTYEKARDQRPDHPASHRLLAWAQFHTGQVAEAVSTLQDGLNRSYPADRFRGVVEVMREDLAWMARAWSAKAPKAAASLMARLSKDGSPAAEAPALRFVLHWETDANDVDLHVYDGKGDHAFYSNKALASGGRLLADVTTGYGPEGFSIPLGPSKRSYPYELGAHYYRKGPLGYGFGSIQVMELTENGDVLREIRPFVVMNDGAYVDAGTVTGPLSKARGADMPKVEPTSP